MHKLLNMIYEVENNGQMSHSSAIDMNKIHKLANLCVRVREGEELQFNQIHQQKCGSREGGRFMIL